jgi:hypothetical protein
VSNINSWPLSCKTDGMSLDDDKKEAFSDEDEDKENIAPGDVYARPEAAGPAQAAVKPTTQAPSSRKDLMTDEPRTPLGDLNPSEYYAEGCDATSVVLVADEVAEPEKSASPETDKVQHAEVSLSLELGVSTNAEEEHKLMNSSELANLLQSAAPIPATEEYDPAAGLFDKHRLDVEIEAEKVEPADIEIWESGSAKDEAGEGEENIFAEL